MVNGYILPQKALQDGDSCVVKFWRKTKSSANWCAQQNEGIPRKTASLFSFNSVLFAETYLFPCKKCLPTI